MLFKYASGQPSPLPECVVSILHSEIRQIRGCSRQSCSVEGNPFTGQNSQRPAVRNDVVDIENENMILSIETQEVSADQRASRQVKRTAGLFRSEPFNLGGLEGFRHCREVGNGDGNINARRNPLGGLATRKLESGAQNLVAANDRIQRRVKLLRIQRSRNADSHGDIVERAAWFEAVEKPETFLRER